MENLMKVGPKGQVVVPQRFREAMNMRPGSSVLFKEEKGRLYLEKAGETEKVFARIARGGSFSEFKPHEAYEGSIER
jgi:AbrB family looped-hinge helix DNA binding protein